MKVLMFGWEFPPHITGGLGTACYGLTRALAHQGTEIKFVIPKSYGDENQDHIQLMAAGDIRLGNDLKRVEKLWKNVTCIEIGSNLIPYVSQEEFAKISSRTISSDQQRREAVFAAGFTFSGAYGKDLMSEVARYALVTSQLAGEQEFDLIHAHDWLTYPAGIAAKKISGKPLVVHVHATEFDRCGMNVNQNVYEIERKGMEAAEKVIAVSNLTRNTVIYRYGISPDKVFTVHNGVEPVSLENKQTYQKNVKEKIVTFLGRVTFQKGPDYFVEVARKVLRKDKNVRFVMAGSGDMLNKMIRRVAKLGISHKFHFTGFLKGGEVDNMFDVSDVYVMPSVSEPFGISPLEAMRSNVPVVISKQSGVAEILKHAVKVDFWDTDAMADAIYGLLNYRGLSRMFKKWGRAEVDNLKWEHAAFKVKKIYEQMNGPLSCNTLMPGG